MSWIALPSTRLPRVHRDEAAQGLIEFAIIAMAAAWIFLGTVDFARFLYFDSTIRNAARVGAEVASEHCAFRGGGCGTSGAAVSDTYVLWSTSCEASSNAGVATVHLTPTYSSCAPTGSPSFTPPCVGVCTNCTNDVCVSSPDSPRVTHSLVTVSVGYSFKPVNPLIGLLFSEKSCYSGDSTSANHHTLCSSAVGRVF